MMNQVELIGRLLAQAATDFLWTKSGFGQLDLEEAA